MRRHSRAILVAIGLLLLGPGCQGSRESRSAPASTPPPGFNNLKSWADPATYGLTSRYDPHAVKLEVDARETTGPMKGKVLVIATLTDENGQPRGSRKIEWSLRGAGRIEAVDRSDALTSKGSLKNERTAISYTNYVDHSVNGPDGKPVPVRAGQTWCLLSSDEEGDTYLTVTAPDVEDATRGSVQVIRHWCDVDWSWPAPVNAIAGRSAELVTKVVNADDRRPQSGYKVRYRTRGGVPVQLGTTRAQEAVAITDPSGEAKVLVHPMTNTAGPARIGVEILRTDGAGTLVTVGQSEAVVEWLAPQIGINIEAPGSTGWKQTAPITITVANQGAAASQGVAVKFPLPPGTEYVSSDPPAKAQDNVLLWQMPTMPGGTSLPLKVNCRFTGTGTITTTARVESREGQAIEAFAKTRIARPHLELRVSAPENAAVDETIEYAVSLTNVGDDDARAVHLRADFDPTLEHTSRSNPLEVAVGTIEPGQTKTFPLVLSTRRQGRSTVRLQATGEGNLEARAAHHVQTGQRSLAVKIQGVAKLYIDREGKWDVQVTNDGTVPQEQVELRLTMPNEVPAFEVSEGGQVSGRDVRWRFEKLAPGESQTVHLKGVPKSPSSQSRVSGSVSARNQTARTFESPCEMLGVAVLRGVIRAAGGPVPVKKRGAVEVRVSNPGTLTARNVVVQGTFTAGTLAVRHVTGPTLGRVQGDQFRFEPIPAIEPGQTVIVRLEGEAIQPGDARLSVQITSETLNAPILVEESTIVVPATPEPEKPAAPPPALINPGAVRPPPGMPNGGTANPRVVAPVSPPPGRLP